MNMCMTQHAQRQTSKVPTRVALLFYINSLMIFYSVPKAQYVSNNLNDEKVNYGHSRRRLIQVRIAVPIGVPRSYI